MSQSLSLLGPRFPGLLNGGNSTMRPHCHRRKINVLRAAEGDISSWTLDSRAKSPGAPSPLFM